jgi:hypothetical protein
MQASRRATSSFPDPRRSPQRAGTLGGFWARPPALSMLSLVKVNQISALTLSLIFHLPSERTIRTVVSECAFRTIWCHPMRSPAFAVWQRRVASGRAS